MTTSKTNLFVSFSASSKSVNSILKGFVKKLKNYIARGAIREKQGDTVSISEETDPQKLELEFKKTLAYSTFCGEIYIFLSKPRVFSIRYLDYFKERILREKKTLFSKSENMEMLFLIELIKDIRKLRQKIAKNKGGFSNEYMEADINQMIYKLYNNLPEDVFYRLECDRMERQRNEMLELGETVKELYPNDPEAQDNYFAMRGFFE